MNFSKELLQLKAKFAAKKSKVRESVTRIPKNGYNSFNQYSYVLEADLVDSLRTILHENSLDFDCEVLEGNKNGQLNEVAMAMTLTDCETGYSETKRWMAEGQDKNDKGYYKAYTGAIKTFLMKTFLISTGDDPEQDTPQNNPGKKREGNNYQSQENYSDSTREENSLEWKRYSKQVKEKREILGLSSEQMQALCGTELNVNVDPKKWSLEEIKSVLGYLNLKIQNTNTKPAERISDNQIKAIFATGAEKSVSADDVKVIVYQMQQVKSMRDLSYGQASEVISYLNKATSDELKFMADEGRAAN